MGSCYVAQGAQIDECPPNQTKEEEIGNLPDNEFRIMIVKLIQNLEIKMESLILCRPLLLLPPITPSIRGLFQ